MKTKFTKYFLIAFVLLISIGCDQSTKKIATENLVEKDKTSYFYDFVHLIYAKNEGAFLSLGDELNPSVRFLLLKFFPVIILLSLFLYILFNKTFTYVQIIAFSLVLGGGFSNLFDRIANGFVVDFMLLELGSLHTGIFNFADMFIMIGLGMLIFVKKE